MFDDGEVFVFAYCAILIGIRSRKLPRIQSAPKFTPSESAVVVTIESIKQNSGCLLCLIERHRSIVIGVQAG